MQLSYLPRQSMYTVMYQNNGKGQNRYVVYEYGIQMACEWYVYIIWERLGKEKIKHCFTVILCAATSS